MLFVVPMLHELTGRQQELVLLIQGLLQRDRETTPGLRDIEVEHAVRALAETYETASRGIIYEHAAGVASAERLGAAIRTLIETLREKGMRIGDADVAGALRRIEQGARDARAALPGGDAAYLDLLNRLHPADGPAREREADGLSGVGRRRVDRPGLTGRGALCAPCGARSTAQTASRRGTARAGGIRDALPGTSPGARRARRPLR